MRSTYRDSRDGRQLVLSAKEFALLEALMRQHDSWNAPGAVDILSTERRAVQSPAQKTSSAKAPLSIWSPLETASRRRPGSPWGADRLRP
jgi:hypothetical protein